MIISNILSQTSFQWILMDISQKRKEVGIVIDRLTAKPILKNGAHMLVLLIIMPSIGYPKAFHHRGETFLFLL